MKSLRELFRTIKASGSVHNALRDFNMLDQANGKAKSVKKLAERLGFAVDRQPLRKGFSGYLEPDPFASNGYRIVVNSNMSVQRQRWTVLHEMGHFYLHSTQNYPFEMEYLDRSIYAFYETPTKEREANQFAEVLLFGDGALEAAISIWGNDAVKLAKHFGTTEEVIKIAIKRYGK